MRAPLFFALKIAEFANVLLINRTGYVNTDATIRATYENYYFLKAKYTAPKIKAKLIR